MTTKRVTTVLIGDIAAQTGVGVETIRYYEREGLISVPARTKGGQRVFDHSHVQRLSFVRRSRELGFSLDDVRRLLQLADKSPMCSNAAKELTDRHLNDVRGKIASLRKLENALTVMTAACAPGEKILCPILEAVTGSREAHSATEGAGPDRPAAKSRAG